MKMKKVGWLSLRQLAEDVESGYLFKSSVLLCFSIVLILPSKPIDGTNDSDDDKTNIHVAVGTFHQTECPLKQITGFIHQTCPRK